MVRLGHGTGQVGGAGLLGRARECALLDEMIETVRAGESRVLVVYGAPGVGKSALLGHAVNSATGVRVLRAAGIESEMELPFAALHQLCAPLLEGLEGLPAPQREALETVFGIRAGTAPERFLVGLAVLSLLSDAAERDPLLCVVDDAQWIDRASAQVLGFVARRLLAESVALVFASRELSQNLRGLPELEVTGLADADAHALLDSVTHARLDQRVRAQVVAETRGNPLALLELPRGLSVTQMAGGFGLLHADKLPDRIEQSFLARIEDLPGQTRLLLLIAAAEPTGDPTLMWSAAELLGVTQAADVTAGTDGLLTLDGRVIFRHPLVRSAVYGSANLKDRRLVHLALAKVTDVQHDPDRRAWHLASATAAPDESVAAELERSADRAQARGGMAAGAAFLQRSMELTVDATRRAERALAAAGASQRAGDLDTARKLADVAERDAQTEFQRVRVQLIRGRIAFSAGFNGEAAPLVLAAAQRLEPFDIELARESYLLAWGAAPVASADGDSQMAVSRAVRKLPPREGSPRTLDLVLEGYALLITEGRSAAIPTLRKAMTALEDYPPQEILKWGWATPFVARALWDDRAMRRTYARAVEVVRAAGALTTLPMYLTSLGMATVLFGEFDAAAAIIAEEAAIIAATGVPMAGIPKLMLRGWRGKEAEASALIAATIERAAANDQLAFVSAAHWANAVLNNGLSRYKQALSAAQASTRISQMFIAAYALAELIEAASRLEDAAAADSALSDLADALAPCDTDWAQGILARCRALLADDAATADGLYREAIERLGRTLVRPELARAHLLYGEWLRRDRQRAEARAHLRTAYDMFTSIGMEAFAERARRELLATGETVRKRTGEASSSEELTPQERQIALLVREGLTNPEVGAQLFLSPRTVEWHLRKIFTKLGISSRRELIRVQALN